MIDVLLNKTIRFASELNIEIASISNTAALSEKLSFIKNLLHKIISRIAPSNTTLRCLRFSIFEPEPQELSVIYSQYKKLQSITESLVWLMNNKPEDMLIDIKNELDQAFIRLDERLNQLKPFYHRYILDYMNDVQLFAKEYENPGLPLNADYCNLIDPCIHELLKLPTINNSLSTFEYVTQLIDVQKSIQNNFNNTFSILEDRLFKLLEYCDQVQISDKSLDLQATAICRRLRTYDLLAFREYWPFMEQIQHNYFTKIRQQIDKNANIIDSLEFLYCAIAHVHPDYVCNYKKEIVDSPSNQNIFSIRANLIDMISKPRLQAKSVWTEILIWFNKFKSITLNLPQLSKNIYKEYIVYELSVRNQVNQKLEFIYSPILEPICKHLTTINAETQFIYDDLHHAWLSHDSNLKKRNKFDLPDIQSFRTIIQNSLIEILATEFYPEKYCLTTIMNNFRGACLTFINTQLSLYDNELLKFAQLKRRIHKSSSETVIAEESVKTFIYSKNTDLTLHNDLTVVGLSTLINYVYNLITVRMELKKKIDYLEKNTKTQKSNSLVQSTKTPVAKNNFVDQFSTQINQLTKQLEIEKQKWWSPNKARKEKKLKFLQQLGNEETFVQLLTHTKESDDVLAGRFSHRVRSLFFTMRKTYERDCQQPLNM